MTPIRLEQAVPDMEAFNRKDGIPPSAPVPCSAKSLVYLATPYSHAEAAVREARFNAVNKVAAELMRSGLHIFSPISHTHPIAEAGDLPRGWDFWQAYDRAILASCGKLIVLMLDGWRESKGVAGEVAIANEMGIPVEYISPSKDSATPVA